MIEQLGRSLHPGSSTRPGWTYQPMADLDARFTGPVHKPAAVRNDYQGIMSAGIIDSSDFVCDVGCSTGYYPLRLARDLGCRTCGIEADPAARTIAEDLGVEIVSEVPAAATVVLMMNVHMWLPAAARAEIMPEAASRTTFFQTASKLSGGMQKDAFEGPEDELVYLTRWWPSIELVQKTTLHGGIRFLWLARPE